jgi:hypothetical protein
MLTRAFVPDPFGKDGSSRLYRTAIWDAADGQVEYLVAWTTR